VPPQLNLLAQFYFGKNIAFYIENLTDSTLGNSQIEISFKVCNPHVNRKVPGPAGDMPVPPSFLIWRSSKANSIIFS
jgi:hypothetical protein